MIWNICFYSALAIWAIGIIMLIVKKNKVAPFYIIFGSVVLSSFSIFFPIYSKIFSGTSYAAVKTVFISLHNTIRLFVGDGEFNFITDNIGDAPAKIVEVYALLSAALYVLAPALTFGFILSFFKNVTAYRKYLTSYFADLYIFSELNEKSYLLAKDLKKNQPKRCIIFNDVFEMDDEPSYELIQKAKELNAILFKKDISVINFDRHSKKAGLTFFVMGNDEDENIQQTYALWDKYSSRKNSYLYVFTQSKNSELLFQDLNQGEMKLRRVNEVQSFIGRHLFDNGIKIFESAKPVSENEKAISVVIAGLGQYGMELLKSLTWFCQMDGYRLEVNAFGTDENAKKYFESMCPEIMDEKHNGDFTTKGEAHYKINIHSGVDFRSLEFKNAIREISDVTYVFVGMENDESTIETAVEIRTQLLKDQLKPVIDALVWDVEKCRALANIKNFKQKEYGIHFIGDMESSYSEKVVLHSDLEKEALARHLQWGEEEEFWRFEYNYCSSIASAIHRKMRILCQIPGADKSVEQRSEDELWGLRELEHCRWNAYMRSIGYTYAQIRDDMAKTHHCLVPFEELSLAEKEKDDI